MEFTRKNFIKTSYSIHIIRFLSEKDIFTVRMQAFIFNFLTLTLGTDYTEGDLKITFSAQTPHDQEERHMDANAAFFAQYLQSYEPYKKTWNYEDSCVLVGAIDLFYATGNPLYRDFVLGYLSRFVKEDGSIPNFDLKAYSIDNVAPGRALFFALTETGDPRYEQAIRFHAQRLSGHPRCECGNYWHKEIYPDQIWLDGLYMAQPFRALYAAKYGDQEAASDIRKQFENVRKYLWNEKKGLYYHACDTKKVQPWADPETGCSHNFWLRSMGWYLMALIDCADFLGQRFPSERAVLEGLLREAVSGILRWQDKETGLFYQVIDRADVPGNYLETSGSAMVLYALLKGTRLGVLDQQLREGALNAMSALTRIQLKQDGEGLWHLNGICKVAGLGPGEKRDGSVEYYLSEPIAADDAKGVGPYMMAVSETY